MLLETKQDRQIGREAVGDGDDNDVCLYGGLTPLTTCQQRRPRYHRREAGRTLLSKWLLVRACQVFMMTKVEQKMCDLKSRDAIISRK